MSPWLGVHSFNGSTTFTFAGKVFCLTRLRGKPLWGRVASKASRHVRESQNRCWPFCTTERAIKNWVKQPETLNLAISWWRVHSQRPAHLRTSRDVTSLYLSAPPPAPLPCAPVPLSFLGINLTVVRSLILAINLVGSTWEFQIVQIL